MDEVDVDLSAAPLKWAWSGARPLGADAVYGGFNIYASKMKNNNINTKLKPKQLNRAWFKWGTGLWSTWTTFTLTPGTC